MLMNKGTKQLMMNDFYMLVMEKAPKKDISIGLGAVLRRLKILIVNGKYRI